MSWDVPETISVRDLGPRWGLRFEVPVTVADRIGLVTALVDAGLHDVETASFLAAGETLAMAGAAELFAGLERDEHVRYWGVAGDVDSTGRALAAGVDGITVPVSVCQHHAERTLGVGVREAIERVGPIAEAAGSRPVDVVIACAFGSSREAVGAFDVAAVADEVVEAGAARVTLSDTFGTASPDRVADLLAATGIEVCFRFRDTRGMALTNAFAALTLGVHSFDTAIGGIGHAPRSSGADGLLATEELVHLCAGLGIDTGVDVDRLVSTTATVAALIGRPVPSRVAAALRR